jgi:hypothetical protein
MDFPVSGRFAAFVHTMAIVLLAGCGGSPAASLPRTESGVTTTVTGKILAHIGIMELTMISSTVI